MWCKEKNSIFKSDDPQLISSKLKVSQSFKTIVKMKILITFQNSLHPKNSKHFTLFKIVLPLKFELRKHKTLMKVQSYRFVGSGLQYFKEVTPSKLQLGNHSHLEYIPTLSELGWRFADDTTVVLIKYL